MIKQVAEALKASFIERIEASAGEPFAETGVVLPANIVWESYARAAIKALRDECLSRDPADYSVTEYTAIRDFLNEGLE